MPMGCPSDVTISHPEITEYVACWVNDYDACWVKYYPLITNLFYNL
jgi:hypothetical protein